MIHGDRVLRPDPAVAVSCSRSDGAGFADPAPAGNPGHVTPVMDSTTPGWARRGLEQADAAPQRPINVGFDGVFVMQIDDSNDFVLLTPIQRCARFSSARSILTGTKSPYENIQRVGRERGGVQHWLYQSGCAGGNI